MKNKGKTRIVNPTRKFVFGILLTLILTGILWVIMIFINILSAPARI